jgi:2-keto-4-pentenoate hydratase/2-oxohepta-3-ene-1,7-dioic acid hydratase in catechol pathway
MNLLQTPFGLAVERPRAEPLPIRHILCIGRNYADHASEMGGAPPENIVVFTKNPAATVLSGDPIVIPKICQEGVGGREQVDYEGELAVIIDKPARDVPLASALDCVLGYACANDVSARWWQKQGSGGQFCRGKSFDTFCPLGPAVVPAGDVPDPQKLTLVTRVSGEEMQRCSTSLMLVPVATLIHELSKGTTLLPGTAILTGTPAGVGAGRTPPRFLREGDSVEVEITGLGTLTNPVKLA